jgi:hypothetical protein
MLTKDFDSKLKRLTLGFWCSRAELEQLADAVLRHPKRIEKLLRLIFHENPRVQAQAARILVRVADKQPGCVQPYKDLLIEEVANGKQWIVQVSFCKIIPQLKLTVREVNRVVKLLLEYLNEERSVVKVCAMQALFDLALMRPKLKEEIFPLIESMTHTGTPAMRARGRLLRKKL